MHFDLRRYLNWFRRYSTRKYNSSVSKPMKLWMTACSLSDLYLFQEMRTFNSRNSKKNADAVCHWRAHYWLDCDWSVTLCEWEVRACERNNDRKLLKNSVLFERRYLDNGKSDRNETKSILQRKVYSLCWVQ